MKRSRVIILAFGMILTFGLTAGVAVLASLWTSGELSLLETAGWVLFASLIYGVPTAVVLGGTGYSERATRIIQVVVFSVYALVLFSALLYVHYGASDWTEAERVRGDVRCWGMAFGIAYGFAVAKLSKRLKTWVREEVCTT